VLTGIKEVGGATIVYRTRNLRDASSWRYDGLLCSGDGGTGAVWLVQQQQQQQYDMHTLFPRSHMLLAGSLPTAEHQTATAELVAFVVTS
jgi:hypothetical protein